MSKSTNSDLLLITKKQHRHGLFLALAGILISKIITIATKGMPASWSEELEPSLLIFAGIAIFYFYGSLIDSKNRSKGVR